MKSTITREFRGRFSKLPKEVQERARDTYRLWLANPWHPSLHFKKVGSSPNEVWSVRIGIGYRALGVADAGGILWFWIGTHASYDRLLKKL